MLFLNSKYYKWGLIVIMAGGLFSVIFIFGQQPQTQAPLTPETSKGTGININTVKQVVTRDGKTEWELDTDSFNYLESKNQAKLTNVKIIFFLKNQKKARLTAKQGILQTKLNNMSISGNVKIQHQDYLLETEKLFYNHAIRTISTDIPVFLSGPGFNLTADTMAFMLESECTELKGHVKGIFN